MINRFRLIELYNNDLTYEKIGAEFGVTRQRIQQIVKKLGLTRNRKGSCVRVIRTCQFCKKEIEITASRARSFKYCSVTCHHQARTKYTPEERRLRGIAATLKSYYRMKENPVLYAAHLEKNRVYGRTWWKKHRATQK